MLDSSDKIEYKDINDSTYAIVVTINNIKGQKEYPYINDVEMCKFIPKFALKFNNSLVFITGTHQHYRLLTVFQLINCKIIVNEFENELMLNSSEDGFEKMLFFYDDQPVALFLGDNGVFVKLYKKKCIEIDQRIEEITVSNNEFVVNYKNKKKQRFNMNEFK